MKGKALVVNREAWLTELAYLMEPLFRGYALAPYRVTCGWPSRNGTGLRKRTLGECHPRGASPDGIHEIFITPTLGKEDAIEVGGILCHEMAHVAAGTKAAHGKEFVRVCSHVGLTRGKPTQAMPGEGLEDHIADLIDTMGTKYPHVGMTLPSRKSTPREPGFSKMVCVCGGAVRVGRKWVEEGGVLVCACGQTMSED